MIWLITSIVIMILITGGGIAICYFFVSRFLKNRKINFLVAFLIFGLLIGIWSSQMGKTDLVFTVNFPGSEISEIAYNDYMLPYWESALEPIGYEQIPIIDLKTGEIIDVENVPQYDFPLKKVTDLYIPVSLLFWGLIGLIIQLIYNKRIR